MQARWWRDLTGYSCCTQREDKVEQNWGRQLQWYPVWDPGGQVSVCCGFGAYGHSRVFCAFPSSSGCWPLSETREAAEMDPGDDPVWQFLHSYL